MMKVRRYSSFLLFVLIVAASASWAARPAACHARGWTDVRVAGPFVVRANFPLVEFEELLKELARLQLDLERSLGVEAPKEFIELYLFSDERTYRAFLKYHFPDIAYRRALFLKHDGPGRVLVHKNAEFEIDIRHECTHALLHSTLPMVPLWLDEGLAEYFEQPPERRVHDNPYFKNLKWTLRLGGVADLEKLERKGHFSELGREDYRDSWAWVHFLLHGPPETRHELIQFLRDIQASTPPGVFSQRLARRLPNARAQMTRHFVHWKRPPQEEIAVRPGQGTLR
ncbi:MAG: DUF1570 domain-containing protein [Pirellulaceae bacterium]|nr:DUF1570 domain-containing protein [Pirellulaceae bacterium]